MYIHGDLPSMPIPDELRRYVPRTDLYDSYDLIHYHMPIEQPPSTTSYIIFKKGNKTYAKNGVYGHIEYEDENATTTLQNVTDALRGSIDHSLTGNNARGIAKGLIFIKDDIEITSTIDLADTVGLKIVGKAREYGTKISIKVDNAPAFDLTNARHLIFENLQFRVESGYTPTTIFLLARDSSGASAGDHAFISCAFEDLNGGVTSAGIYNYASEVNNFIDCKFHIYGKYAVKLTTSNIDGLESPFKTIASGSRSTLQNRFFGCEFYGGTSPSDRIGIEGGGNHAFIGCYFGSGPKTAYAFHLLQPVNTSTVVRGLWVYGCRFEDRIITSDTPNGASITIRALSLIDCDVDADDTAPIIDLNKFNDTYNVAALNPRIKGVRLYNIHNRAYEYAFRTLRNPEFYLAEYIYDPKLTVTNELVSGIIYMYDSANLNITGSLHNAPIIICHKGGGTVNSGTATIAAGSTSVTVSHGLVTTPSKVLVTPISDPGDRYWVANIGSTSFDIVVATAPTVDIDFYWEAEV